MPSINISGTWRGNLKVSVGRLYDDVVPLETCGQDVNTYQIRLHGTAVCLNKGAVSLTVLPDLALKAVIILRSFWENFLFPFQKVLRRGFSGSLAR